MSQIYDETSQSFNNDQRQMMNVTPSFKMRQSNNGAFRKKHVRRCAKELKKEYSDQHFPLYVAEIDSEKFYIIELRGVGLWDAIWGYMSLKSDFNTINGVSFDHKGETAGLGAEITKDWFKDSFVNEKVFNENGDLVGITVLKGNNDPNNTDKDDHEVDAISGSTITGDGVTDMIIERLNNYLPYLKKLNSAQL